MTSKATVVVVKATGTVLGVVTHEGDPERAVEAAEVAGDAFPVRDATGDVVIDVPVAELGATIVPVVDDLLTKPQLCAVVDGRAGIGATPTVAMTKTDITVTAGQSAPQEREVRLFVEHGQGSDRRRFVFPAKIPANDTVKKIDATFAPGEYEVLAAVPGHRLLTETKTVPV